MFHKSVFWLLTLISFFHTNSSSIRGFLFGASNIRGGQLSPPLEPECRFLRFDGDLKLQLAPQPLREKVPGSLLAFPTLL